MRMHFIQREKFREINVSSHALQQMSDLKIFHEYFPGPAHPAQGPVVASRRLKYIAQIRLLKPKTKHLPITTITTGKWLQ